jgi:hypothetical protein
MKKNLVDQKQVFGEVQNHMIHANTMSGSPIDSKPLGGTTVNGVNARDHGPAIHDVTVQAKNRASQHNENPFFWTGRPKK